VAPTPGLAMASRLRSPMDDQRIDDEGGGWLRFLVAITIGFAGPALGTLAGAGIAVVFGMLE
jgi:hypothetical protein